VAGGAQFKKTPQLKHGEFLFVKEVFLNSIYFLNCGDSVSTVPFYLNPVKK
jgi:hypothetical protein